MSATTSTPPTAAISISENSKLVLAAASKAMPPVDDNWRVQEELALIQTVAKYGSSDWNTVCKAVRACVVHGPFKGRDPTFFLPAVCENKFKELQDKAKSSSSAKKSDAAGMTILEENLRQKRMQQVADALQVVNNAITAVRSDLETAKKGNLSEVDITRMYWESRSEKEVLFDQQRRQKIQPKKRVDSPGKGGTPSSPRVDVGGPNAGAATTAQVKAEPLAENSSASANAAETAAGKSQQGKTPRSLPRTSTRGSSDSSGRASVPKSPSLKPDSPSMSTRANRQPSGEPETKPTSNKKDASRASRTPAASPAPSTPVQKSQPTPASLDSEMLKGVWQAISSMDIADPFRKPVTAREAPTYRTVIKRPMDLGTVKRKIDTKQYTNVKDFSEDMNLIFSNAKTFNEKNSEIYRWAAKLAATFKKELDTVRADLIEQQTLIENAASGRKRANSPEDSSKSASRKRKRR